MLQVKPCFSREVQRILSNMLGSVKLIAQPADCISLPKFD